MRREAFHSSHNAADAASRRDPPLVLGVVEGEAAQRVACRLLLILLSLYRPPDARANVRQLLVALS